MFIINCATAGVCVLYGVYVYRVLRHAPYHDFKWLARRTRTGHTGPDATGRRETHPPSNPMSHIEVIGDADHYEGARRIYSGEAAAKLVASAQPDETAQLPAGWPPKGSQN